MSKYSIKDLEKLTGIKAHTIRIWEKRYDLLNPERTATNIRYYTDEDLKRLLNISILNRNGLKISRIACLSDSQLGEKLVHLNKMNGDYDTLIDSLTIAMIELDDFKFEKLINTSVMKIGFEDTFLKVIFPFLNKIGLLWLTGSINPAQEHFVSNLIRQKMIVAIDGAGGRLKPGANTFLLFLPQHEMHELALLFYQYLIKKYGHKVIYLGQTMPVEEAVSLANVKHADYILMSFTSGVKKTDIYEYLNYIAEYFTGKTLITGSQIYQQNVLEQGKLQIFKDPNELKEILDHINHQIDNI